jgi:hypothetical protein
MKAIDVPLVVHKSGGALKRVSSNELTRTTLEFIAAVAKVWPGIEKDAVVIKKPVAAIRPDNSHLKGK